MQSKKYFFVIIIFFFFLISCAGSKTNYFPDPADKANCAEVTIIRNKNIFGALLNVKVISDGWVIANLPVGHYVSFFVEPGVHTIGITESTISIPYEKQKKYYFLVTVPPGGHGFEIERIDETSALKWVHSSTKIE